jgi:hypothetical protein
MNELQSEKAEIKAQIVIRDKDGNVKFQGPIVMTPIKDEKEPDDGSHPR